MVHCKVFWTVLIGLQRVISSTHKLIISAGTLLRLSSQENHQLQVQDALELHHLMFRPRSWRRKSMWQDRWHAKKMGERIVAYPEKSHGNVAADVLGLGKYVGHLTWITQPLQYLIWINQIHLYYLITTNFYHSTANALFTLREERLHFL